MNTSVYAPSELVLQWNKGTFSLTTEYYMQVASQLAPAVAAAVILVSTLWIWSCCICCHCKPAKHEAPLTRLKMVWVLVAMVISAIASAIFIIYGLANSAEQHTALGRAQDIISAMTGWPVEVQADVAEAKAASDAYVAALNNALQRFECDMVLTPGLYSADGRYPGACVQYPGTLEDGTPWVPYALAVQKGVEDAAKAFTGAADEVGAAVGALDLSALDSIGSTIADVEVYRNTYVGISLWSLLGLMIVALLLTGSNIYRGHKRSKSIAAAAQPEPESGRRKSAELATTIVATSPRKSYQSASGDEEQKQDKDERKGQFERSCAGAALYTSVITLLMLVFLIVWCVAVALGAATFVTADVCADPDAVFLDLSGLGSDPQFTYFVKCDEGQLADPNADKKATLDEQFEALHGFLQNVSCTLRADEARAQAGINGASMAISSQICPNGLPAGSNSQNSNGDTQLLEFDAAFEILYTKSGARRNTTSTDPRVGLMAGLECYGERSLNAIIQSVFNWLCRDVFHPVAILCALMLGLGSTIFILDCSRRIARPPQPGRYRSCCGWREKRRVGAAPEHPAKDGTETQAEVQPDKDPLAF